MSLKLLIADDEDTIRNGMYRYLKLHTERYAGIYTAADGEEAMEQILFWRPDVMLIDICLPIKNGITVIKEAAGHGLLPVTLVMGSGEELQYAELAVRAGARGCLLTPFRAQDVLAELLEIADELEQTGERSGAERERMAKGAEAPQRTAGNGDCAAGKFAGERARAAQESAAADSGNALCIGPEEAGKSCRVAVAEQYIRTHYAEEITLAAAARIAGVSPGYLSTLFSGNLGCGFTEYLNQVRVENACAYLREGGLKTYEIAFRVGFRDEKYFSRVFRKIMGMTPSEYRRSQKKPHNQKQVVK